MSKLSMMVVDDSNIIRNKIIRSIDDAKVDIVAVAHNGKEAVAMFKANNPDIVTMDITMPEMDGIECIEQLVAHDDKSLILVISALADKATAIQALKKGAHGFLCKPFSDEGLNQALNDLVEGAMCE